MSVVLGVRAMRPPKHGLYAAIHRQWANNLESCSDSWILNDWLLQAGRTPGNADVGPSLRQI